MQKKINEALDEYLELVLKSMSTGKVIIMDLDGTVNANAWGELTSKLGQKKCFRNSNV